MEWINYVLAALTGTGVTTIIVALLNRRWQQADKLDGIRDSLEAHIARDDERYAKQCRTRILRFNDELIRGYRHTKEHFDDVLEDITEYKQYCRDHTDFKNEKAVMAIANVQRVFQLCEADNSFLS